MKRQADDTIILEAPPTKVPRLDARPLTRPTTGLLIHPYEHVETITVAAELDPDVDVAVEPEYEYVVPTQACEAFLGKDCEEYGYADYLVLMGDQSRAYRHRCGCHQRRRNLLAQAVVESLGGDSWNEKDDWEGPVAIFGPAGRSLTNEEMSKIRALCKTALRPMAGWSPPHSSSSSHSSDDDDV